MFFKRTRKDPLDVPIQQHSPPGIGTIYLESDNIYIPLNEIVLANGYIHFRGDVVNTSRTLMTQRQDYIVRGYDGSLIFRGRVAAFNVIITKFDTFTLNLDIMVPHRMTDDLWQLQLPQNVL